MKGRLPRDGLSDSDEPAMDAEEADMLPEAPHAEPIELLRAEEACHATEGDSSTGEIVREVP